MDKKRSQGFTLVELLVVIAIIAILIALLLPAVQAAREAARRIQCGNHVKQLGLALQNYHSAYRTFPINWGDGVFNQATVGHSLFLQILPYMEQQPLYDFYDQSAPMTFRDTSKNPPNPDNPMVVSTVIEEILCPSDDTGDGLYDDRLGANANSLFWTGTELAANSYKFSSGANWGRGSFNPIVTIRGRNAGQKQGLEFPTGFAGRNGCAGGAGGGCSIGPGGATVDRGTIFPTAIRDIRDGTSNTFALGETIPELCRWNFWANWDGVIGTAAVPLNHYRQLPKSGTQSWVGSGEAEARRMSYGFMSRHPGGGNFGLCDGSVRFVTDSIQLEAVYYALATISGGEIIPEEGQ